MKYKDKYIKYKTKYTQIGGKNIKKDLQFILFGLEVNMIK